MIQSSALSSAIAAAMSAAAAWSTTSIRGISSTRAPLASSSDASGAAWSAGRVTTTVIPARPDGSRSGIAQIALHAASELGGLHQRLVAQHDLAAHMPAGIGVGQERVHLRSLDVRADRQ